MSGPPFMKRDGRVDRSLKPYRIFGPLKSWDDENGDKYCPRQKSTIFIGGKRYKELLIVEAKLCIAKLFENKDEAGIRPTHGKFIS